MNTTTKTECPRCRRYVSVTSTGKVRKHNTSLSTGAPTCGAIRQAPSAAQVQQAYEDAMGRS